MNTSYVPAQIDQGWPCENSMRQPLWITVLVSWEIRDLSFECGATALELSYAGM